MTQIQHPFDASNTQEQIARGVGPAKINIAYERLGDPNATPVVLIMGGAAQMIHWPDAFCGALVERGLQVIRFDNRDCGHSTHIEGVPAPDLPAVLADDFSSVSYTLSEMAADTVGLLDVLGLASAHVVGASMGGQIAQVMACEHLGRVRSLVSMMSTTGNPGVGQVAPHVLKEVFSGPPAVTRDEVIAHRVSAARVVGSPAYPGNPDEIAARAGLAFDRSNDLAGLTRQAIATVATGDRTERLRQLDLPTLVIHGLADPMCDVSGGRATAEAIPGAELILIEGMGHDLAPGLRALLATHIADFVLRVERC
jgi:pimeloyl-ACP methyl ester carboxylesterase